MIAFLLARPTWLVIAALIAALVGLSIWHQLTLARAELQTASARRDAATATQKLADYQAAIAAETAAQIARNQAIEAQWRQQNEKLRTNLEDQLRASRDRFERLRLQSAGDHGGTVSDASGAAGLDHGAAEDNRLPRCVAPDQRSQFIDLLVVAQTTADQLIACQQALRDLTRH
jgi:hypothetical protein